jgi:hypothetical protein
MRNEKGSAIALVLLVLGVVSLVGAGFLVQTRFDTKFAQAQKSYDRSFGLADSAASYAFPEIMARDSVAFKGGPTVIWSQTVYVPVQPDPASTTPFASNRDMGRAVARALIEGYDTDPTQMAGWELGTAEGYHVQFWIAEGLGLRGKGVGIRTTGEANSPHENILPNEAVFMAAKKFAKN